MKNAVIIRDCHRFTIKSHFSSYYFCFASTKLANYLTLKYDRSESEIIDIATDSGRWLTSIDVCVFLLPMTKLLPIVLFLDQSRPIRVLIFELGFDFRTWFGNAQKKILKAK